MDEPQDVDMTASITLPAQNHDRQDDAMEDSGEPGPQVASEEVDQTGNEQAGGDVEASVDAMDTTPDPSPQPEPVPESSPSQAQSQTPHTSNNDAASPTNAANNPTSQSTPPPVAADGTQAEGEASSQPPLDPASDTVSPPADNSHDDDSTSDSGDEDPLRWYEIHEDRTVPTEEELKYIESNPERSALDGKLDHITSTSKIGIDKTTDSYWKKRAFTALPDPEYKPGAEGVIKWTIDKLNGTKEEPNKELMMLSESVQIGDYNFRMKLYPSGIDPESSSCMCFYLNCESMSKSEAESTEKPSTKSKSKSKKKSSSKESSPTTEQADEPQPKAEEKETVQEWQHTPLPLLEPKRLPKRPSVAAQFVLVMYNPEEPRVHQAEVFAHRFSPGAPDHGSTHFTRPKSDLAMRNPNQRRPLYQNDKLAFIAYVRLIHDETGCLWERTDRNNPYDSLAITGLQGISTTISTPGFGHAGGNLISAISSWMLLMPFRELLYKSSSLHSYTEETMQRPKPMLLALQKILYCLRTRPDNVGTGAFALEDLAEAFEWYALDKQTDKYDTIEVWEIMRTKLEEELVGTEFEGALNRMFGIKRDRKTGLPSYKVPVRGMKTMQNAINTTENLVVTNLDAPQVLTIELERYLFNDKKRAWQKLSEQLKLDETVMVHQTEYKLFGFVVHKENTQSGSYYPILRPDGPEGKWYMYTDYRDDYKVRCLTRKMALDAHEGTADSRNNDRASVAYAVTYLRADIADIAFNVANEPEWNIPSWMVEEIKRERELVARDVFAFDPPQPVTAKSSSEDLSDAPKSEKPVEEIKEYEFSVVRSSIFSEHEGSGLIDLYDPKWQNSQHIFKVKLKGDLNSSAARGQIAAQVPDIKDPRQCKLWLVGSAEGTLWRPSLFTSGKEFSGAGLDYDIDWMVEDLALRQERRLWLHIVDEKDLPPLPEPPKTEEEKEAAAGATADAATTPPVNGDAPPAAPPATTIAELEAVLFPDEPANGVRDEQMGGTQDENAAAESALLIPPVPANPNNTADPSPLILNADTDMGDISALPPMPTIPVLPQGTVANGLPTLPSLLPSGFVNGLPPPPAADTHRPDEVYFFLKTFDPKTQSLKPFGSFFVERHAHIGSAIHKILETDKQKKPLDFYEEEDIATARWMKQRHSFAKENIDNGAIIVITDQLDDEAKAKLSAEGLFPDPTAYLRALGEVRTFPEQSNGTFKLDYFSAESYEGDLAYHLPHGHGKKIYHNSDVYTGTFVLGQRHGSGSMTFANGDTYEGLWENGLQHGQGTFVEADTGNKYVGSWKGGKKHGEGVTYWKMAQEEQHCCKICWEKEADAVLIECGHVVSCLACARQVKECPVCRKLVSKAIRVYMVA
jgi:hypothetical protein